MPVTGFLLVNPRSGDTEPSPSELHAAATRLGVQVHVLEEGEDAAQLARAAAAPALGMAGGDGSLASVATVAIERNLPFVCVPLGTRNHFARDLGLEVDDPLAALAAFTSRFEQRVDVGQVNGRLFLNNLSIGAYAELVDQGGQPGLVRLVRAWWRGSVRLNVDGQAVHARVVLFANNAYELSPFAVGVRHDLNTGRLHLYTSSGFLSRGWEDVAGTRFRVESDGTAPIRAALDGEPVELDPVLDVSIRPSALRALVLRPPGEQSAPLEADEADCAKRVASEVATTPPSPD